jgi:hypothetical protein
MPHPLLNEATEHARIVAELKDMFGEDDQQALLDTAEGLSDFNALCELVLLSREDDLVLVTGLGARIEEMRDRLDRYKARAQAKKELVEAAMIRADVKKLEFAEFTVSLGKRPRKLVITSEAELPPECMRQPPAVPDKEHIRTLLDNNFDIPGAYLSNGSEGLNIRKR